MRESYGSNTLDFFYDASGMPYALKYNDTVYYYVTNLQGDVMQIVDANGSTVASYEYDPYGKVISATGTLAEVNPIRYRGYYYDSESGLYYLQSRYYDPTVGRFLNADSYVSTGQGMLGNNMFAYCCNTPVNYSDPSGNSPLGQFAYAYCQGYGGSPYITDQDHPSIAGKRFGLATVSHGGCGVIATYNALISLGQYTRFDKVLSYYNQRIFGLMLVG